MELARKYFSHSLVLIDDRKDKTIHNNVVRALFGLLKTCQAMSRVNTKEEAKNDVIMEITKERISEIYSKNTDMNIHKMHMMKQ